MRRGTLQATTISSRILGDVVWGRCPSSGDGLRAFIPRLDALPSTGLTMRFLARRRDTVSPLRPALEAPDAPPLPLRRSPKQVALITQESVDRGASERELRSPRDPGIERAAQHDRVAGGGEVGVSQIEVAGG